MFKVNCGLFQNRFNDTENKEEKDEIEGMGKVQEIRNEPMIEKDAENIAGNKMGKKQPKKNMELVEKKKIGRPIKYPESKEHQVFHSKTHP